MHLEPSEVPERARLVTVARSPSGARRVAAGRRDADITATYWVFAHRLPGRLDWSLRVVPGGGGAQPSFAARDCRARAWASHRYACAAPVLATLVAKLSLRPQRLAQLAKEARPPSSPRARRRRAWGRVRHRPLNRCGDAPVKIFFPTSASKRGLFVSIQRNEQQLEKRCEEVNGFRSWDVGVVRRGELRVGCRERRC
jgi:hypothetical protein